MPAACGFDSSATDPGDASPPPLVGRDPSVSFTLDVSPVAFKSDHVSGGVIYDTPPVTTAGAPPRLIDPLLDRPPAEPPPIDAMGDDASLGNSSDTSFDSIDADSLKPPPGSMFDPAMLQRPPSPDLVTDFPYDPHPDLTADQTMESLLAELPQMPTLCDSVTRVVHRTRVFGLYDNSDAGSVVKIRRCTSKGDGLIDGGSNICLTNRVDILVDVVDIPPLPISVAVDGAAADEDLCCTKKGLLPLSMDDGSVYYQTCYFCENAAETIISPQAIVDSSDVFYSWTQCGYRRDSARDGRLRFDSHDGFVTMSLDLAFKDGLYYCSTDAITVDANPLRPTVVSLPRVSRVASKAEPSVRRTPPKVVPTSKARQLESELWLARYAFPGESQLDSLPANVIGTPAVFEYHPFRFIDFKEQARIRKQAAGRTAERTTENGKRFYMDFGFLRASTSDYSRPDKKRDRIIQSYDGYNSYLIVVDEASRYVWVFLCKSKDPPLNIIHKFLRKFGCADGGFIRTD